MTAIVVDNSIVLYALLEGNNDGALRHRLIRPRTVHAPHLLDYEFANALRGLLLGGKISERLADEARTDFADLPIQRCPGSYTADRIWELRHNFTAYDAAYIALAELLECPLLTGDAKLRGNHQANIELMRSGRA